jgi:folate-binding protein YgfZ
MSEFPYATIAVTGPDAFEFLQAQLTADLDRFSEGASLRSAWCNPKGRVICLMTVSVLDNGYALTLPAELADTVVQRLTMFRFRSKVEFDVHSSTPEQAGIENTVDEWLLENLSSGIPEVWLAQSEQFTPHMLNLDLLGVVSLNKGCYPGQEIVARTHYRGTTKRRCLRFKSAAPLSPGDKISDGEHDVGEVVNAIGNDLLAIVPVDKADESLTVDGNALLRLPLPYL